VGQIANTFTGQGLAFAHGVISDYKKSPAPFHVDDGTRFVNVLITDGQTSQGSSSVQTELQAMVNEGIDTYVIGFGTGSDLDEAQLQQYAMWGNTKSAIIVDPSDAAGANALADALAGVVIGLGLDACCVLDDCAAEPEPADPKPVCGDGRVEGDEVCDDGKDNATYDHCGGRCDGPHLYCGDGRVDLPETCDDGNSVTGDGCDDCRLEGGEEDAGMEKSDSGIGGQPAGTGTGGSHGTTSPPPRRPRAANGKADAGKEPGDAAVITSGGDCGCSAVGGARALSGAWILAGIAVGIAMRSRRRLRNQAPAVKTFGDPPAP
jgi:cysteine-rich repeat protein